MTSRDGLVHDGDSPADMRSRSSFSRFTSPLILFLAFEAIATVNPASVRYVAMQSRRTTAATATPDVTKLGAQVGDKVPDFRLPDQHGQTRTLASLMGRKGLVLVFNRSADW